MCIKSRISCIYELVLYAFLVSYSHRNTLFSQNLDCELVTEDIHILLQTLFIKNIVVMKEMPLNPAK